MLPLKAELVLPLCINQHLSEAEEKEQKSECKKEERINIMKMPTFQL